VVDVGEVARTALGAKLVSLVKGLEISAFGDRMAGVVWGLEGEKDEM
jgi:hypothetical protein